MFEERVQEGDKRVHGLVVRYTIAQWGGGPFVVRNSYTMALLPPLVKEYTLERLKIWSVIPVAFVTQQAFWYYMVSRFPKSLVRCFSSFVRYC